MVLARFRPLHVDEKGTSKQASGQRASKQTEGSESQNYKIHSLRAINDPPPTYVAFHSLAAWHPPPAPCGKLKEKYVAFLCSLFFFFFFFFFFLVFGGISFGEERRTERQREKVILAQCPRVRGANCELRSACQIDRHQILLFGYRATSRGCEDAKIALDSHSRPPVQIQIQIQVKAKSAATFS